MHPESERTSRMNAAGHGEHIGLVMRAIGWQLLIFDMIPVVFVWVGLRDGSWMWLWWALVEGLVGSLLVIAGNYFKEYAAHQVGRDEPDFYKSGNMEPRWNQDHAV